MVTSIEGRDTVEKIKLIDAEKKEYEMPMAGVFVYIHGSKPIVDFLYGTVPLTEAECLETNRLMETSLPGIFAAGDVTCTELRQVVIAAADGAKAALAAEKFLHRRTKTKLDWGK
jgi:thioredoxin reductase (NADPH)